MTAAFLWVLSDNELAIYLNGGYGAEKRNQAMAIVRDALKKAAGQKPSALLGLPDQYSAPLT